MDTRNILLGPIDVHIYRTSVLVYDLETVAEMVCEFVLSCRALCFGETKTSLLSILS